MRAELSIGAQETLPVPLLEGQLLSGMQISNWQTCAGRVAVLRSIPSGAASEVGYDHLVDSATRGRA